MPAPPTHSQVSALPALQRQGKSYDQVASLDSFARSPASFYGFWLATMRSYREARPHAGYEIMRQWCDSLRDSQSLTRKFSTEMARWCLISV